MSSCLGAFCSELAEFKHLLLWLNQEFITNYSCNTQGPILFGHPCSRPRTYASLVLKSWACWTGSEDHYNTVFQKQLNADANAYFVADDQQIRDEFASMAERRGCSMPKHIPVNELDFQSVMTPGMEDRCKEHQKLSLLKLNQDDEEVYVADVEQNTTHYNGGPVLGSLVTHGCLFNFKLGRPLVPKEHLWVQGLPVLGEPRKFATFVSCVQPLLDNDQLSRKDIKQLAGNAMHCPTVTSVICYALCKAIPHPRGNTDGAELSPDSHGKSPKAKRHKGIEEDVNEGTDSPSVCESPGEMKFMPDGSQYFF